MFLRNRGFALTKPKKLHSLEYLKYLHSVIQKNANVTAQNCEAIVEALRLIGEILIWGDQNDSAIMDLFLEKNMLEYFLQYMKQNPDRLVCTQLLQTLNIMFENITNQTAVYYLMSNNHTNSIITHRFDFSDEEVVAYYISFLKTLSLRLNAQTINFFFLEQRREFSLYIESIKLFSHPESMIRIAVRTITLNIHRVRDEGSLGFIHHQTALPYYSHLVWSIGNVILDMDTLVKLEMNCKNRSKVEQIVAEHIDHLHYINDLLSLGIEGLNEVLCDQLMHRLFIPLHLYSLTQKITPSSARLGEGNRRPVTRPSVAPGLAMYVLTHTFIILHQPSLMPLLTEAIALGDCGLVGLGPGSRRSASEVPDKTSSYLRYLANEGANSAYDKFGLCEKGWSQQDPAVDIARSLISASVAVRRASEAPVGHRLAGYLSERGGHNNLDPTGIMFLQPSQSLEAGLRQARRVTPDLMARLWPVGLAPLRLSGKPHSSRMADSEKSNVVECHVEEPLPSHAEHQSSSETDSVHTEEVEGKEVGPEAQLSNGAPSSPSLTCGEENPESEAAHPSPERDPLPRAEESEDRLASRPFMNTLFWCLEVGSCSDYECLLAMLLLLAIRCNKGIDSATRHLVRFTDGPPTSEVPYDVKLVDKLLIVVREACRAGSRVRLVTLRVAVQLVTDLLSGDSPNSVFHLSDAHVAQLISAREDAMMTLRSYFKADAIFLDLFEDEVRQLQHRPVNSQQVGTDYVTILPTLASPVFPRPKPKSPVGMKSPGSPHRSHPSPGEPVCRDPSRRLPQTESEHARKAVSVFVLVHTWTEALLQRQIAGQDVPEGEQGGSGVQAMLSDKLTVDMSSLSGFPGLANVPDSKNKNSFSMRVGERLDLSPETLIGCIVERDGTHERRYLITRNLQLMLVEPDSRQLGWGVITFVGPLQNLEAHCDVVDSRCLHVTIQQHGYLSRQMVSPRPGQSPVRPALLSARFLFEDHIRCMTARELLVRGRDSARQTKLLKIASMLDFSLQFIREKLLLRSDNSSSGSSPGGPINRTRATGGGNPMVGSRLDQFPSVVTSQPLRQPAGSGTATNDLSSSGDLSGASPSRRHGLVWRSNVSSAVSRSTRGYTDYTPDQRPAMVSLAAQPSRVRGAPTVSYAGGGYDLSDGHSQPLLRLTRPREAAAGYRLQQATQRLSVHSDLASMSDPTPASHLSHSTSVGHLGPTAANAGGGK